MFVVLFAVVLAATDISTTNIGGQEVRRSGGQEVRR